jgi:hypothetical protein
MTQRFFERMMAALLLDVFACPPTLLTLQLHPLLPTPLCAVKVAIQLHLVGGFDKQGKSTEGAIQSFT